MVLGKTSVDMDEPDFMAIHPIVLVDISPKTINVSLSLKFNGNP